MWDLSIFWDVRMGNFYFSDLRKKIQFWDWFFIWCTIWNGVLVLISWKKGHIIFVICDWGYVYSPLIFLVGLTSHLDRSVDARSESSNVAQWSLHRVPSNRWNHGHMLWSSIHNFLLLTWQTPIGLTPEYSKCWGHCVSINACTSVKGTVKWMRTLNTYTRDIVYVD